MAQAKMHRMEEDARKHADMGDQMDAINYEKLQIENQELHRKHKESSVQLLHNKHAAFLLLQARLDCVMCCQPQSVMSSLEKSCLRGKQAVADQKADLARVLRGNAVLAKRLEGHGKTVRAFEEDQANAERRCKGALEELNIFQAAVASGFAHRSPMHVLEERRKRPCH